MMLGGNLWLNTQELPLEASGCLGSNSGQLLARQVHSCAVLTLAQDTSFVRNLSFFFFFLVGVVWVTPDGGWGYSLPSTLRTMWCWGSNWGQQATCKVNVSQPPLLGICKAVETFTFQTPSPTVLF